MGNKLNFQTVTPEWCRAKYEKAQDKFWAIGLIADLTASNRTAVKEFLGVDDSKKRIDDLKAHEMLANGCEKKEIAKAFGVTENAVNAWEKRNGLFVSKKEQRGSDMRMALYRVGLTDPEIASETGYSKSAIFNWRARHGLPANGTRGGNRRGRGRKETVKCLCKLATQQHKAAAD